MQGDSYMTYPERYPGLALLLHVLSLLLYTIYKALNIV